VGDGDSEAIRHIVAELGFVVAPRADEIVGSAPVVPQVLVPGSTSLRTSILAAWADIAAGHLAVAVLSPRVPVTLELDVHLYEERPAPRTVHAVARSLKTGRTVGAFSVDFTDEDGEPLAFAAASFMAAHDPQLTISPEVVRRKSARVQTGPLRLPFAERAGCERREPGVAVLRRSEEALNASNTVNGGLIALAVEEAVLSATPGTTLASLAMRTNRHVTTSFRLTLSRHGALNDTSVSVARPFRPDAAAILG
jgi:acyl-coenzyme A thioesterase PaaI-like protein